MTRRAGIDLRWFEILVNKETMAGEYTLRLDSGVRVTHYAWRGDFATADAVNIHYFDSLKNNLVELTGGSEKYGRALALAVGAVASYR